MLDQKLLDILCCPKCKGKLTYASQKEKLTCEHCSAVYRVKDNIPIMLPEDAAK
ncbi:MAG: Trm112 family protein [Ignavibacteriae bacterium]|nr:Trm112 family protein [Ignavibacteriota bacterium]